MPENEKEIERSDAIVDIVEKILRYNNQNQNQEQQWLKILTPNQILSWLKITLAQLKAGNHLEKPKSEIRQLLYYLHPSKKLYKKSINIWFELFKNGNNLYEIWKY